MLDHLKDALRDHAGLRQLNAARRKKEIEETLNDDSQTKNLFNDLLKADPTLASLFGVGDRLQTKVGPGEGQPFVGKKFPTFFRLAKNPQGGLVKGCPVNLTCRVEFETDAVNDYFKRGDCPGTITIEPANLIEHSNLWNGRFTAQFKTPWDAKPGDRVKVKVKVTDIERHARSAPFESEFTLLAEREQDRKSKPGPRPNPPNGNGHKPGNQSAPGLGIPQLNWKAFADQNVSLQVRHDDNGQPEYFANLNNQFLTAELIKAKEDDRALVKFWFGYGLLLCALGMLKNQKERLEAKREDDDETVSANEAAVEDLKQVSAHCDGIARVIIPIIRTLYRGPSLAAA